MKMDLIPMKKIITANQLREVTDPVTFERGNVPSSNGLLSNEIFGINTTDRKNNYAYIDLKCNMFHPVIYKSLLRMNRNIEYIIQGIKYYKIDEKGELIEDENGQTGIDFLYKNWEKINFNRNDSKIRNQRIDLLEAFPKDVLFTRYWLVIPAFYRDIRQSGDGENPVVHELTKMYSKLIRLGMMIESSNDFEFMINNTKFNMQLQLVEIYDNFKSKLEKKTGLIKKSLMGKSVDYGSRTVISAPRIGIESLEYADATIEKTGIPLYQCCSLATPFMIQWVKNFFRREIESVGSKMPVRTKKKGETVFVTIKNPELYFTEEYVKKHIEMFIRSPFNRFDKIYAPVESNEYGIDKVALYIRGNYYQEGVPESESPLVSRQMTWTDILYMAAVDITQDKHVALTRYPISDITSGLFITGINVLSTVKTIPMYINNTLYKKYPVVEQDAPTNVIPTLFTDTVVMSNAYLKAIGGDEFIVSLAGNCKLKNFVNA